MSPISFEVFVTFMFIILDRKKHTNRTVAVAQLCDLGPLSFSAYFFRTVKISLSLSSRVLVLVLVKTSVHDHGSFGRVVKRDFEAELDS